MTSYFGEPEFAERFAASRRETAAVTAARIIEIAGISTGERVIDLCCGPGLVSELLAERVAPDGEVIGVDASAAMIELARKNVTASNARFIEGDAYALPSLVPEPVDCVVATSAWQNFLTDKERIISSVRGVLKPGGRFVFDIRLREREDDQDSSPVQRYRNRVLTLLHQEYPDVTLTEHAGAGGPFGVRIEGARPYSREDIDRDIALLEGKGFRLGKREEIAGGPFAGAWLERQHWRVEYWLARVAPSLPLEGRTKLLDRVAQEARAGRASKEPQVSTVYVAMLAAPRE